MSTAENSRAKIKIRRFRDRPVDKSVLKEDRRQNKILAQDKKGIKKFRKWNKNGNAGIGSISPSLQKNVLAQGIAQCENQKTVPSVYTAGSKDHEIDFLKQELEIIKEMQLIANDKLEETDLKKKISVLREKQADDNKIQTKNFETLKNKYDKKSKPVHEETSTNDINELINNSPSPNKEKQETEDDDDNAEKGLKPTTSMEQRLKVLKEEINMLESMALFARDDE